MSDEWNMSLDDEVTKESFVGALNMEKGIYEGSLRMFAPYYRQAAMKACSLGKDGAEPYLELAYSDVSSAFRYYLENENGGRLDELADEYIYRFIDTETMDDAA